MLRYFARAAIVICILLTWQYLGVRYGNVRLFISTPHNLIKYASTHSELLMLSTLVSTLESLLGLLIAALISATLLMISFYTPSLLPSITQASVISQTVPLVAVAPFVVIVFGLGIGAKVIMAALLCFFPLFVNAANAYVSIPRNIEELLYVLDAKTLFRISRVYLPMALPGIFNGFKVSSTLAVVGALVAEFSGANYGLGKNIFIGARRLDADLLVLSLAISSALGIGFYYSIIALERILGKWYLPSEG